MSLLKKFAIAATMALPLALAGCGQPTINLCAANDTGNAIGSSSYSQIFNGAAEQGKLCYVQGSDLQDGGRYAFGNGLLVIDGDVPANSRIHVEDGKLFIAGDVGADARVSASVPEETSTYTTIIPIFNGKTTIMVPQTHTRFEHFTYQNDIDPAVIIAGDVAEGARIASNHDMYVGGDNSMSAEFRSTRSEYDSSLFRSGISDYHIAPIVAEITPHLR
jgi:hypothetical protein